MTPTSFEAPDLPELQELLPAFRFEALIAQGGMGAVYKARQISLDRDVAIKILPREFGSNAKLRQSFDTEARAMARLNHPNLIGVFDSGNARGLPYIVMEYVQGKSLFHSSHGKVIDPQQSVELIIDICKGLAHAHENGIIHRDIKPANILLTPRREPKIGDFGLAQHAGTGDEGLAMGTPHYTAPEIYADPTCANERSDIFAVGVILYELLTGGLPDSDRTPPSTIVGTDRHLDEIWSRATDRDASQRYSSIGEMCRDLELWLNPSTAEIQPADPSPAPPTLPAINNVGLNWSLMRNLVIIAILLTAIGATWKAYKSTEESRIAKQTPPSSPPLNTPPKPLPLIKDPGPPSPAPPAPSPTPAPLPTVKPETPVESLTRLRNDLLQGRRDEFPSTTLRSEHAAYFFIPSKMSWDEARRFATDHGATLPLIENADSLKWLTDHLPGATSWLGTAAGLDGQWQQLDSSPWPLDSPPKDVGKNVLLRRDGTATAQATTSSHPFYIQWQLDGSNPCDLKTLLARTRESLETSKPVYPLGTLRANGSHYLIVNQAMGSTAARSLAESAGAHLMVPSHEAEADWMSSQLSTRPSPGPLLIGASRKGFVWCWDTGEAWTFARWAADCPRGTGSTLAINEDGTWGDFLPNKVAAGLILEWSTPIPLEETSELDQLRERAAELITNLNTTRREELKESTKVMLWSLESWLRNLTQQEAKRFSPAVDRLKNSINKDRVPRFLNHAQEVALPAKVVSLKKAANEKQDRIDHRFEAAAMTIREAYLKRISDVIASETQRGQLDLVRDLEAKVTAPLELNRWIASLGVSDAEGAPVLTPIEILKATYSSRGRNADVTAKVKELIEVEQKPFRVLVSTFGIDPDPGWNKSVLISFVVNGQKFGRWYNRNSLVSPAILMEHAASKLKPEED